MDDVTAHRPEAPVDPVRSTGAVLGVLAAIIAIPLLALAFLVLGGSGDGAGVSLVDGLDADAVHAVYLTNDLVYFGRVADAHGAFFELEDAYFLRRSQSAAPSEAEPEAGAETPSEGETELVPVSQEVGGTGTLLVNAHEVVRVQPLADDSEIAQTLEDRDDD